MTKEIQRWQEQQVRWQSDQAGVFVNFVTATVTRSVTVTAGPGNVLKVLKPYILTPILEKADT